MPRKVFTVNALLFTAQPVGSKGLRDRPFWGKAVGKGSGVATVLVHAVGSPSIPLSASRRSCIRTHSWCICRSRAGPQPSTAPLTPRQPTVIPAQVHVHVHIHAAAHGAPRGSSGYSANSTGHLQVSHTRVNVYTGPLTGNQARAPLGYHLVWSLERARHFVLPPQIVSAGLQEKLTDEHLSNFHFQRKS